MPLKYSKSYYRKLNYFYSFETNKTTNVNFGNEDILFASVSMFRMDILIY